MDLILPYKIGDLAECRSFEEGYRGAWFRCKINDMRVESGHLECYLEYTDYPDENKEWIRLFQKNPAISKPKSSDQIMVRPSFPQWHWKDEVPEQLRDDYVTAVVDENWKVGDLVDWFSHDCYWSGEITELTNDEDAVEVKLPEPPIGEGEHYMAKIKDLRPTLDWSLTRGWSVPLSQARGKGWHVVRLINHKSTESETSDSGEETSSDDGDKGDSDSDGGDSQDVQHMIYSNRSPRAPGSPILPSSAAKSMPSLNAQKNDTLRSMEELRTSLPSNPRAPSNGVQLAVTSSTPGIGINERGMGNSIEQDQSGNVQDQYLQNLAEADGNRKELLERTRLLERKTVLLSFLKALDDPSIKTN